MKKRQCSDFWSGIKPPYHKIQISGKGNPKKIWKQQPRYFIDSVKFNRGYADEREKNEKPDKGRQKRPEIEKYNAPAKVENKLKTIKQQSGIGFFSV